ncbi:MAG: hypothetical protein ACI92E_000348 [Oceanicoccus sp.]|jgi:hypothetical protein
MNRVVILLLVCCTLAVSGCAQTGSQIGKNLRLCCPGDYVSYREYGLEVVDMPLFLADYIATEFTAVLEEKGLIRNDRVNDVKVVLRYKQVDLVPGQEVIDPYVKNESLNIELSYIATVEIDIIETQSSDLVWAGSVSRVHRVRPGEYMHEDRARPYFYSAFQSLLVSYPVLEDLQ